MVEKKRFDGSDAMDTTGMPRALRARATASGAVSLPCAHANAARLMLMRAHRSRSVLRSGSIRLRKWLSVSSLSWASSLALALASVKVSVWDRSSAAPAVNRVSPGLPR